MLCVKAVGCSIHSMLQRNLQDVLQFFKTGCLAAPSRWVHIFRTFFYFSICRGLIIIKIYMRALEIQMRNMTVELAVLGINSHIFCICGVTHRQSITTRIVVLGAHFFTHFVWRNFNRSLQCVLMNRTFSHECQMFCLCVNSEEQVQRYSLRMFVK